MTVLIIVGISWRRIYVHRHPTSRKVCKKLRWDSQREEKGEFSLVKKAINGNSLFLPSPHPRVLWMSLGSSVAPQQKRQTGFWALFKVRLYRSWLFISRKPPNHPYSLLSMISQTPTHENYISLPFGEGVWCVPGGDINSDKNISRQVAMQKEIKITNPPWLMHRAGGNPEWLKDL